MVAHASGITTFILTSIPHPPEINKNNKGEMTVSSATSDENFHEENDEISFSVL